MKLPPLPDISAAWIPDLECDATFAHDGRTETVIEITNEDHSATVGYAVPEYSKVWATLPALLFAGVAYLDDLDTLADFCREYKSPERYNVIRKRQEEIRQILLSAGCTD